MKHIAILFFLVAVSAQAATTVELKTTPGNGKVQFEAVGRPAMVKIKGQAEGPQSSLTIQKGLLSGELTFPLKSLDTGIDLRNEHMKEKYLEIGKYPEARLKIKDLQLPEGWSPQNATLKEFPFKGILNLHGVEKEINGVVSVSDSLKAEAQFEIKISDFKIDIPSYLGVTVADRVTVLVSLNEFAKQEK